MDVAKGAGQRSPDLMNDSLRDATKDITDLSVHTAKHTATCSMWVSLLNVSRTVLVRWSKLYVYGSKPGCYFHDAFYSVLQPVALLGVFTYNMLTCQSRKASTTVSTIFVYSPADNYDKCAHRTAGARCWLLQARPEIGPSGSKDKLKQPNRTERVVHNWLSFSVT